MEGRVKVSWVYNPHHSPAGAVSSYLVDCGNVQTRPQRSLILFLSRVKRWGLCHRHLESRPCGFFRGIGYREVITCWLLGLGVKKLATSTSSLSCSLVDPRHHTARKQAGTWTVMSRCFSRQLQLRPQTTAGINH